ncbi:MAG: hypothetical protein ACRD2Q_05965 [Terriglobales bacterium]
MSLPNKNAIALAGEFAVAAQLMLLGYDASLTFGHTKSIDILVSKPGGSMFRLECKTSKKAERNEKLFGRTLAWTMSAKHEKIIDPTLFCSFVSIGNDNRSFRYFIVPSKVVARYVDVEHRHWMKHHPSARGSDMRSFRIGLPKEQYSFETPLASTYEDTWF